MEKTFAEYRYKTSQALERIKTKIEEVEKNFKLFLVGNMEVWLIPTELMMLKY